MFDHPILPLLRVYHCLCLECPLIERTNVLNWLKSQGQNIYRWPLTLEAIQNEQQGLNLVNSGSLKEALNTWITGTKQSELSSILVIENGVKLIKDHHLSLGLFEIIESLENHSIIFLEMSGQSISDELSLIIPSLKLPVPQVKGLETLARELGLEVEQLTPGLGLYLEEIRRGVRLAQINEKPISATLLDYKIERFQALGLALNPTPRSLEVGGMDLLKQGIERLKLDYSASARLQGIPLPKGWLLAGPPGTGKSYVAKLIAHRLQFGLVTVGVEMVKANGAVYLSNLLARMEAAAPLVCYFDEFDKFFQADGKGEESKTREVLGVLLTWLQEKKSSVFVLATLNRLDALPPELTRAGRFDKIWYVGFPQAIERKAIFQLHAGRFDSRYQVNDGPLTLEQWQILLDQTNYYTGAEIQSIVETAARQLFYQGQMIELTFDDLLAAKNTIIPLFSRDTERVLAMMNRVIGVAENVSSLDNSIFAPATVNLWGEAV